MHLVGFIIKKFVMMRGHMNVKNTKYDNLNKNSTVSRLNNNNCAPTVQKNQKQQRLQF